MPSLSSKRRFSRAETKELFKKAMEKRPSSIQSLRESIAINNSKYQRFVTIINRSTEIFHTTCNKAQEEEEDQQKNPFKKFVKAAKMNKEGNFFKRVKFQQHKNMQKQLILPQQSQAPTNKFIHINKFFSKPTCHSVMSINHEGLQVINPSSTQKSPQTKPTNNSVQSMSKTQSTSKFWKKKGKDILGATVYRLKTEGAQRIGENSIGDMTQYSNNKQTRSINFLIFQLQTNVNHTKRGRQRAGIPP